ncbi:MAG: DUF3147 family protein [Deltaproteobacteria bacterium]|nr:DUF3147 family protein [Deltaproteobacteria bacterium]
MAYIIVKTLLTAVIIVGISEIGKRFTTFAALLAALPLTSLLDKIWLYADTKDAQRIADLSIAIFWLVLPTLIFFLVLPWLLRQQYNFWLSMFISSVVMIAFYLGYATIGKKFGLPL